MVCDKVKAVWTECSLSDASVRHRYIRSRKRLVCSFTLDTLSILLLMFGHQLVTQFLSLMMTFYIKFGSE